MTWSEADREDAAESLNPARLEFARKLAGFASAIELAEAVGVHKTTVWNWQNGRTSPHRATLNAMSHVLAVPASFLTDPTPLPTLRGAFFRAPARSKRAMYSRFEAYASLVGVLALHLFGSRVASRAALGTQERTPRDAALHLRERMSLHNAPIPNLVNVAGQLGVTVVYAPRGDSVTDAFSARVGTLPVIVLNPEKGDFYRQRFDIAHELGHLLLHSDGMSRAQREVEQEADAFASALLYPKNANSIELLRRAVTDPTLGSLQLLQETWGYSVDGLLDVANRGLSGPARTSASERRAERNAARKQPVGPHRDREPLTHVADAAEDYLARVSAHAATGYLALESGTPELYLRAMMARLPAEAPAWPH